MTQYALSFADSKVEDMFGYYYQELLATITQLEAVIEVAKKTTIEWGITSAEGAVKYANETIERRLIHMQHMAGYTKGVVSREVALSAAGTLAGVTDRCIEAIKSLKEAMEDEILRAARQAEREAQDAKYKTDRENRERENQDRRNRENQERSNRESRSNGYSYTAPSKYPAGVTDEAMNLILQCGYRKAAAMNHPDCGGTHEKMVAINASNDYMKKMGLA